MRRRRRGRCRGTQEDQPPRTLRLLPLLLLLLSLSPRPPPSPPPGDGPQGASSGPHPAMGTIIACTRRATSGGIPRCSSIKDTLQRTSIIGRTSANSHKRTAATADLSPQGRGCHRRTADGLVELREASVIKSTSKIFITAGTLYTERLEGTMSGHERWILMDEHLHTV